MPLISLGTKTVQRPRKEFNFGFGVPVVIKVMKLVTLGGSNGEYIHGSDFFLRDLTAEPTNQPDMSDPHSGTPLISATLKNIPKLISLLYMEIPVSIYSKEISFGIFFGVAEILKFPV
jgi:hypothetical protein